MIKFSAHTKYQYKMKKIKLKKLQLSYFKGIRKLSIDFSDEVSIMGANEAGKTTIFDAFCYLLFGKDSNNNTAFGIKTLLDGKVLEKVDHEVSGVIEVDGKEITLKKTYREKWVKERGSREPVMKGHENLFEWNDVPMKEQDYKAEVNNLVNEGIFKLITNPLYFNSLKWQERRQILIGLTPEVTHADVAAGDTDFELLIKKLNGKTIDQYKTQISASKRKIKDDLDAIPTRIDELQRSIDDEPNYEEVQSNIDKEFENLELIDRQIRDKSESVKAISEKNAETQETIYNKRREIERIKFELRAKLEFADREGMKALDILRSKNGSISRDIKEKEDVVSMFEAPASIGSVYSLTRKREQLIAQWHEIDNRKIEFDEHEFNCPTCKRAFEPQDIEAKKSELTSNFNKKKADDLAYIEKQGLEVKRELEEAKVKVETLKKEIEALREESNGLVSQMDGMKVETPEPIETRLGVLVANDTNILALNALIESLERDIKPVNQVDNSSLVQESKEIRARLDQWNRELAKKEVIDNTRKRIAQLEKEEKDKAQELADLEATEFTIDRFIKAMMDRVEESISSQFKYVRFSLFDNLVNGAEVPACETTYKGVPWGDLNTAGRIWAGIDIINTLSDFYKVSAPLWLDNRESTTKIPETESQVINLVVSEKDKKLRIAHKQELAMA